LACMSLSRNSHTVVASGTHGHRAPARGTSGTRAGH
jgi:hypothetical protein